MTDRTNTNQHVSSQLTCVLAFNAKNNRSKRTAVDMYNEGMARDQNTLTGVEMMATEVIRPEWYVFEFVSASGFVEVLRESTARTGFKMLPVVRRADEVHSQIETWNASSTRKLTARLASKPDELEAVAEAEAIASAQ